MSSLTDLYISDSYTGLLHAGGSPLPVSGQITMFDGSGQVSALSLGIAGQGASINGTFTTTALVVGTEHYPSTPGAVGSVLYQIDANNLGFTSELPRTILPKLIDAGKYENIKSITVTEEGLVDIIEKYDDSGGTTISFTTYADSPTSITTITFKENIEEWVRVPLLTTNNFFDGAKGGIFFLEPDSVQDMGADHNIKEFVVSPNGIREYKIMTVVCQDGDSKLSHSVQFQCPLGIENGVRVLYFKRKFSLATSTITTMKLWYIAKQG